MDNENWKIMNTYLPTNLESGPPNQLKFRSHCFLKTRFVTPLLVYIAIRYDDDYNFKRKFVIPVIILCLCVNIF